MKPIAKNNKIKIRVLIGILVLSLGAMAAFGIGLWLDMSSTRQGQEFFAAMHVDVVQSPRETSLTPTLFVPALDFDELREMAPNLVGWLQSQGTVINYPIVQGMDNDFYLDHLPNGVRNSMGSIFLDYRNHADFSSSTIFIYGHNMASGDKFSSLRHYTDQQFFEQHSNMLIFTPERNFEIVIFAGYDIDSSVEVPPMGFANQADFESYIADLRNRSFINSDIEVNYGDQLVFLCTCIFTNQSPWRRIIVGKLVELDW